MSRDPFDEMRDRNPVPTDELPPAPMAMAERIMGKRARGARRPLPGFAVAAVTALAVVVAGGTLLMLTRPPADPGFADGGTTTIAPTTTTAPAPALVEVEASVFFFVDQVGDGWSGGPFLIPLAVTVETREAAEAAGAAGTAEQALLRLFEGVGEHADAIPAMSSAIPSDAEFLGLEYDEESGVVTVSLSGEFASGGGSFSMQGRLAQVVYTATAVEGVTGVRFEVDGVLTTVFGGEGVTIDDPATREGFEDFLPAIMIESPAHGGTATNPLVASGTARVFEATVSIALTDANGLIIWEGFTTATDSVDRRGDWTIEIPYEVDAPQWGHLIVWESSAEDGRQTNVREHRVWLVPEGGTTPTTTIPHGDGCSGWGAESPFVEQDGLPPAVAEKRAAIWDAAVECDWTQLARLLGASFSYSFATDDDPIGEWREREASGGQPMLYLAELLTRPYGTGELDGVARYIWPSASGMEWADVPAADREALRPLYGDDAFSFYEEFCCYIGYRIGILEDGTWVYFIAGD